MKSPRRGKSILKEVCGSKSDYAALLFFGDVLISRGDGVYLSVIGGG